MIIKNILKTELTFLFLISLIAYEMFPNDLLFMSQIAITAIFCISLDLILGYAGILSLGQAAFFGVGAYSAGLIAIHLTGNPIVGLVAGGVISGVIGFLSAPLLLGGRDLTRLLITLGVAAIFLEVANKYTSITGGVDGLQGIQIDPLIGRFDFDLMGTTSFWYSIAVLMLVFVVVKRLVSSPFGLCIKGIRMNAERMPALGTSVNNRLTTAYVMGAVIAGIAGALLAQTNQFVSIDVFSFGRSAELVLILVLGGSGTLYGAVLGAVAFSLAHHYLSEINPQYWQFWLGILLIAIVLFAKDGMMGGIARLHKSIMMAGGEK